MNKLTIGDVIQNVLREANAALSAKEILAIISKEKYYEFKSVNPINIISNELRRHCKGSAQSKNRAILYERLISGGYTLVTSEDK